MVVMRVAAVVMPPAAPTSMIVAPMIVTPVIVAMIVVMVRVIVMVGHLSPGQ